MLTGDWWLTPEGSWDMKSSEHAAVAIAVMLKMDLATARVPMWWTIKGIPEEEFDKALARGADPAAVAFLVDKRHDARLWALREYNWIRTTKQHFNVWKFDNKTAEIIRDAGDYWSQQPSIDEYEMIDIHEFYGEEKPFAVSVEKLLAGGNSKILKDLATGRITREEAKKKLAPMYSTKYTEMERKRLYARTGDNPRRA